MITPEIKGIYVVDVTGAVPHRATKHCVCVSVGNGKYITINTESRPEYGEVKIKASEHAFLKGVDRYVLCARILTREPENLLAKVGTLSDADTKIVYLKIKESVKIHEDDKKAILPDLWKTFK